MKWVFAFIVTVIGFVAIFFLVPTVWSMIGGDPLPQSVRTKFNSMSHIGRRAEAIMHVTRAREADRSYRTEVVQPLYTSIASRFDALIDRAIEGIKLNSVDEAFLNAELDKLLVSAREFDFALDGPRPVSQTRLREVEGILDTIQSFAETSMHDWRRLAKKRDELRETAISQLQAMRWLSWGAKRTRLEKLPLLRS